MSRLPLLPLLFAAALTPSGCSDDPMGRGESVAREAAAYSPKLAAPPGAAAPAPAAGPAGAAEANTQQAADVPPEVVRKIIYNARIDLAVENLAKFRDAFDTLVSNSGAYLASSDESSDTQQQRSATWTVRVPAERVRKFVDGVARLGEPRTNHLDSRDVTEEFFDVEARIKNKQEEEKRILKLLADSTGRLEDVLLIERELTRVRGEIEQMQGRIRFLSSVTSFGSVAVSVTEIKNYVPPVAPTFGTEVGRTFQRSAEALAEFGKGLVLLLAALAPWIPVVLVAALLILLALRKTLSRRPPGNPVV